MSSLLAILSQQTPNLQTRKGLIVLGLQNDFISPGGKLPVKNNAFLDHIAELIPGFREHGDVIFVRSEFEPTRPVNGDDTPGDTVVAGGSLRGGTEVPSKKRKGKTPASSATYKSSASFPKPDHGEHDEELLLSRTSTREPCCIRGSPGAEYPDRVKALIDGKDLQITKTHYSAFGSTSLLLTLRSRLVTDVYICGCMTNQSVYATAMDAARYGIDITLVDDCLGYRRSDRHEMGIRQLEDLMAAGRMTAAKVLGTLRNPRQDDASKDEDSDPEGSEPERDRHRSGKNAVHNVSSGPLQADSDEDSDGEFPLFRRTQSGMYSQQNTGQRPSTTPTQHSRFARPSTCQEHSKHQKATSHSSLSSDESSSTRSQPWLDIIPSNCTSSNISPTLQPTSPPSRHPSLVALSSAAVITPSETRRYETLRPQALEEQGTAYMAARTRPLFGEDKAAESAGSSLSYDLLPAELAETVFEKLNSEVDWQRMLHKAGEVPRLISCQATIGKDGSMPVYRHPSDQTLPVRSWSPTVDRIRRAAEATVGHELNHVLIQLYRDGNDCISEHSDKTLDIVPGSNIVNASFGAQRTMRIRTKRGPSKGETRTTYRVPMPHNSMIIMSLKTNAEFLHAVNWDRRPQCELIKAEKAFGGQRISLTFRHIGTFLNADSTLIWGQGATGKTREEAKAVVNGDAVKSEELVQAFGRENAASSIHWQENYGAGSDVLHLK